MLGENLRSVVEALCRSVRQECYKWNRRDRRLGSRRNGSWCIVYNHTHMKLDKKVSCQIERGILDSYAVHRHEGKRL
jgi:hypothetical protein